MEEQLISFETAKLAKEKGFDEECYFTYDKISKEYCIFESEYSETNSEINKYIYSAPTQSLLQKWLREKHKIWVSVSVEIFTLKHSYDVFKHEEDDYGPILITYKTSSDEWDLTYEEALEYGLQQALKLIQL